jgi:hypothetical protein
LLVCSLRVIESGSAVATELAADGGMRAAEQMGNLVQTITGNTTESNHFALGCAKIAVGHCGLQNG